MIQRATKEEILIAGQRENMTGIFKMRNILRNSAFFI